MKFVIGNETWFRWGDRYTVHSDTVHNEGRKICPRNIALNIRIENQTSLVHTTNRPSSMSAPSLCGHPLLSGEIYAEVYYG